MQYAPRGLVVLLLLQMWWPGRALAAAAKHYQALVVEGPTLNAMSSRSVKRILESRLKLKVGTVQLEDLGRADFTGVKLLYFPGATYLKLQLPEGAAENLRRAVAAGMSYLGTCGGSLLAAEWTGMPDGRGGQWPVLGLFPGRETFQSGTGLRTYYFEISHPLVARSSVAKEIPPRFEIDYNGGPGNYLLNDDAWLGLVHWVVAWQAEEDTGMKTNRPAAVAFWYGRGRVFLTTAHPERPQHPQTHCVIVMAAEWCLGKTDPDRNAPPSVVTSLPERGSVGAELQFSAEGSDDREGFPLGFIWDFGDGSPHLYTPRARHTFNRAGTYPVTLTVTDGNDEVARTHAVAIAPAKPVAEHPGAPQTAKVPKCAEAPLIDGRIIEACWEPGYLPGAWLDLRTRQAARRQPALTVCYDDACIYFACFVPESNVLALVPTNLDRDGQIWNDDSLELLLDPTAGRGPYYRFVVNTANVFHDARGKDGVAWNSTARAAARKWADRWVIEVAVPLAELGVTGSPLGQKWQANFLLHRANQRGTVSWTDPGDGQAGPAGVLAFE